MTSSARVDDDFLFGPVASLQRGAKLAELGQELGRGTRHVEGQVGSTVSWRGRGLKDGGRWSDESCSRQGDGGRARFRHHLRTGRMAKIPDPKFTANPLTKIRHPSVPSYRNPGPRATGRSSHCHHLGVSTASSTTPVCTPLLPLLPVRSAIYLVPTGSSPGNV